MVLFFIDVGTRKVQIAGIDEAPDGAWMQQMARNQTDAIDGFLLGKRYLIHDRDPLYTAKFDEMMKGSGITPKRLQAYRPTMNSFAESFIKTIKSECLNKLILTSEAQLRYVLKEYIFYYNHCRFHRGLGGRMIEPLPQDEDGDTVEFNYLGGLLRSYRRVKRAA
ncbi:MAG: Integrase core domain protein [Smithella sp. PtaU1.Bin162]|nr:MAG: Integrase core domain protein [Smithella sp. PtaU1.Bin162]